MKQCFEEMEEGGFCRSVGNIKKRWLGGSLSIIPLGKIKTKRRGKVEIFNWRMQGSV